MTTVLITGPIGSGKSEVSRRLASEGFPVYDCDSRVKDLYESEPGLFDAVAEALGCGDMRTCDGHPDRKRLASVIFGDPEKMEALKAAVYPVLKHGGYKRDFDVFRHTLYNNRDYIVL